MIRTDDVSLDASVVAADDALRFRFRVFVAVVAALGAIALTGLIGAGTSWGGAATVILGVTTALAVPMLGWRLAIPFAGRALLPIMFLVGVPLAGRDVRDAAWTLANLPVLWFLLGWLVDTCFHQPGRVRQMVGRIAFSILTLGLAWSRLGNGMIEPAFMIFGIALVWIPRQHLASLPASAEPTINRGMRKAGAWLAARAAMVLLIVLPSILYLDLLEMPERLEQELTASGEGELLHWLRENRALSEEDCAAKLEIYEAHDLDPFAWNAALRDLRAEPRVAERLDPLRAFGVRRIRSLAEVRAALGTASVFYVEPVAASDGRATAGLLWSPDSRLTKKTELWRYHEADIGLLSKHFGMAAWIILANSIVVLLVLANPGSGSAVAWWLAIYLAGANMGWVVPSLPLVLEPASYAIWRDYGMFPSAGLFQGIQSLLIGIIGITKWMIQYNVALSGLWIALCWPARASRLIQSPLDAFWAQLPKVVIMFAGLFQLNLAAMILDQLTGWIFTAWQILLPALLVWGGAFLRKRVGQATRLPALGVIVVFAFLIRRLAGLLWDCEPLYLGVEGGWMGKAALVLAIASCVLIIFALERGEFLSPPHVTGQLWLVAVAALPVLASLLDEPVDSLVNNSGLLLDQSGRWLVFGASMLCIEPITSRAHRFLERWQAKGLKVIEHAHAQLLAPTGESPFEIHRKVVSSLEVREPRLWRLVGEGRFQPISFEHGVPVGEPEFIMPARLVERLGEIDSGLRLEEMRDEWRWAAFHPALEEMFQTRGDLLIVPANHVGVVIGVLFAPDVPENCFLLRRSVAEALGALLATVLLQTTPPTNHHIPTS